MHTVGDGEAASAVAGQSPRTMRRRSAEARAAWCRSATRSAACRIRRIAKALPRGRLMVPSGEESLVAGFRSQGRKKLLNPSRDQPQASRERERPSRPSGSDDRVGSSSAGHSETPSAAWHQAFACATTCRASGITNSCSGWRTARTGQGSTTNDLVGHAAHQPRDRSPAPLCAHDDNVDGCLPGVIDDFLRGAVADPQLRSRRGVLAGRFR